MNFFKDESGQTILEYALIIAVLVLVIIAAVPNLRNSVIDVFGGVEDKLVVPEDVPPPTGG
jgi:Flp pilus assembly pilin Flp